MCELMSIGWVAVALGVIWFFAYGIGTTCQMIRERLYQNQVLQAKQPPQPPLPPFTCWTIVTQGFSNGLWAAVGWPAAYVLWVLAPTTASDLALGHVGLLVFALLSVTGWLPAQVKQIFGRG